MRLPVIGTAFLVAVSSFAACTSFSEGEGPDDAGGDVAIDAGVEANPSPDAGSDGPALEASVAASYGAAVLADRPFVYWRMDDIAGGRVIDSSDSGPDATLTLTGTFVSTGGVTGESSDRAVSFSVNGAGSALFDGLAALDATFTFECWVRSSMAGEFATIFSRYVSSPPPPSGRLGILGYLTSGGPTAERDNGSDASYVHGFQGVSIVDKTYHHVVVTRLAPIDGGVNFTLYVDAIPNNAVASNFSITVPPQTRLFIAGGTDLPGLQGDVDEVAIYNYALPVERVVAHYRVVHPVQ